MRKFTIQHTADAGLEKAVADKIDNLTKPKGSLGRLEELALQIGLIQRSLCPMLHHPCNILFAADHGIVEEGVSLSPKEITWQQIGNILRGGAGINYLCRQHGFELLVVDAGVGYDFPPARGILDMKIRKGTRNFLYGDAMTSEEMNRCIEYGAQCVDRIYAQGCNIVSFGEMGIANTSASALWMHFFTGIPLRQCVGAGSGLDSAGVERKYQILRRAADNFSGLHGVEEILCRFGGYEMMMAVGGMLRAAELRLVILVDGFIMTNCLPVINIFKMKSSRGYTNDYYEYHIVPNNVAANDYEVYNIESINFYDNINNLLLTAKPFYYTDVEVQFNNNYDYFAIHRRPRSDGLYTNRSSYKGYEVFASISGEKWQEVRDEIVQYSADLICTNRDLPLYIKANTKVSFAASQIESGVFINAPTKPLNPLINSGRREDWEKINHIMLNLSNILWKPGEVPVKIIKNIIKSYSLLSKDDTERILTSIVSIESEPATFRYINGNNGIFYEQGWKINMVISESKINDIGFFTFACVLWQFFQSYIPINSHIEFNVYSESYGLLKQWIM